MSTNTAEPGAADRPVPDAAGPLPRGIAVLRALTEAGRPLPSADLARRAGLVRAALDRVVATLTELDHVRVVDGQIALAPPVAVLGNAYLRALPVPTALLDELSDSLDESVALGVPDGDGCRVVAASVRRRRLTIACHVGDLLAPEPGVVMFTAPVHGSVTVIVLGHVSRHATAADLADAVAPTVLDAVDRMAKALASAADPVPADPLPALVGTDSLARGLGVLAAFGAHPELDVDDAARVTGLPKTAARRALSTLARLGYLTHTAGRYRPAPAVLSLGWPVLSRLTLAQLAGPHLAALSEQVGHAVSLAVSDRGTEIVYRAHVAPPGRLTVVDDHVGTRLPAYATAMGRVLLAALPVSEQLTALRRAQPDRLTSTTVTYADELLHLLRQVHDDGHAVVEEEPGLWSIAVPVLGSAGGTPAAISVAVPASRAAVAEILPGLRRTADRVHGDLVALGRG